MESDTGLSLPSPCVGLLASRWHIICSLLSPLVFMLLLLSVPSSWHLSGGFSLLCMGSCASWLLCSVLGFTFPLRSPSEKAYWASSGNPKSQRNAEESQPRAVQQDSPPPVWKSGFFSWLSFLVSAHIAVTSPRLLPLCLLPFPPKGAEFEVQWLQRWHSSWIWELFPTREQSLCMWGVLRPGSQVRWLLLSDTPDREAEGVTQRPEAAAARMRVFHARAAGCPSADSPTGCPV